MAPSTDPYKILGVEKNAPNEEIKKAYRALAKQLHPDKNRASDAEDKFKELSAAYELVKDSDKRRVYDMQRAGDEEKANMRKQQQSYASSFQSFPTPNTKWSGSTSGGTSTRGGRERSESGAKRTNGASFYFDPSSPRQQPRTTFTFTHINMDDDEDIGGSQFAQFFNMHFGGAPMGTGFNVGPGVNRRTRSSQRPQEYTPTFRMGANSRRGWDDSSPLFDDFFSDQLFDMSRLFGDLFGVPSFRRAAPAATTSSRLPDPEEDLTRQFGAGVFPRPTPKPKAKTQTSTPLDDMYDWSKPMFDRKKMTKNGRMGSSSDDSDLDEEEEDEEEEGVSQIRFPCVYCGKQMTGVELSTHENSCPLFYNSKSNPAGAQPTTNGHHGGSSRFRQTEADENSRNNSNNYRENDKHSEHSACPWCRNTFNRLALDKHLSTCMSRPSARDNSTSSSAYSSAHFPKDDDISTPRPRGAKPTRVTAFSEPLSRGRPTKPAQHQSTPPSTRTSYQGSSSTPRTTTGSTTTDRRYMDESFDISGSGLHMPRKPPAASNAKTRNMKYNSGGAQDDKKSGKFSDSSFIPSDHPSTSSAGHDTAEERQYRKPPRRRPASRLFDTSVDDVPTPTPPPPRSAAPRRRYIRRPSPKSSASFDDRYPHDISTSSGRYDDRAEYTSYLKGVGGGDFKSRSRSAHNDGTLRSRQPTFRHSVHLDLDSGYSSSSHGDRNYGNTDPLDTARNYGITDPLDTAYSRTPRSRVRERQYGRYDDSNIDDTGLSRSYTSQGVTGAYRDYGTSGIGSYERPPSEYSSYTPTRSASGLHYNPSFS